MENRYKKWTAEEDAAILKNHSSLGYKEIAKMIGRTYSGVSDRAFRVLKIKKKFAIDLISSGDKFGRLTVIKRLKNRPKYFKCLCDCGKTKTTDGHSLRAGSTKSCGCLPKETGPQNSRKWASKGSPGKYRLPKGEGARNALLYDYKNNAKRTNKEWNISDEMAFFLFSQNCIVCDLPPSQIFKRKLGNGDFAYTGIDRLDNSKGYIVENVCPMCKRCNIAKNNMTIKEFDEWIKRVTNNYKGLPL